MYSYPNRRCDVFSLPADLYTDPLEGAWSRVDSLNGMSAFLGMNNPFFLQAPPATHEAAATEESEFPFAVDGDGEQHDGEAAAGEDGFVAGLPPALPPALPVFKPDCVFATHGRAFHYNTQPDPTWIRMHVCGGPAIGSTLNIKRCADGVVRSEAPIWFVPTVPPAPDASTSQYGGMY